VTTLALIALSGVVGCAARPLVSSTRFIEALPARPMDAPVRLYQAQRPSCAYEEIGAVTVKGSDFRQADRLADAMRVRVREMGGDAIVDFGKSKLVVGSRATTTGLPVGDPWMGGAWLGGFPGQVMTDVRNDTKLVLSGTVVRFTAPCGG
jgi:hypothetical protein